MKYTCIYKKDKKKWEQACTYKQQIKDIEEEKKTQEKKGLSVR